MSKKLSERLIKVFKEHGKIIIGFDYDDTVKACQESQWSLLPVHSQLKRAKQQGHVLILNTLNKETDKAWKFCKDSGFKPDCINTNYVPAFQNQSKIYCNIYLDDKCCLTETTAVLKGFLDYVEKETAKTKVQS